MKFDRKWRWRFFLLAREVSTWSKDPSVQVGAVLVSPDRKKVILGYNGFPSSIADTPELLADKVEKNRRMVHAEANAIDNADIDLHGFHLFLWPFCSCSICAVKVINNGIKYVYYPETPPDNKLKWEKDFAVSHQLFDEAGVAHFEYPIYAVKNES